MESENSDAFPVDIRCACQRPRRPLWLQRAGFAELCRALAATTAPVGSRTPLLSYRCRACGVTVMLALGDFYEAGGRELGLGRKSDGFLRRATG